MAILTPPVTRQTDNTYAPLVRRVRSLQTAQIGSLPASEYENGDHRPNSSGEPLMRRAVLLVPLIFLAGVSLLFAVYCSLPSIDPGRLRLPHNLQELRNLKDYLSEYAQNFEPQVMLCFSGVYVFMMTFALPGTVFLSILAGALFGLTKGLLLVLFTATAGASSCYFMSYHLGGKRLVNWLWPRHVQFFTLEVQKRRAHLLHYLLLLRVTPLLPNTFINVASPILNVPYYTFAVATFFGLIPAGFLSVRAGLTLGELRSLSDLYDYKTLAMLFVIGAGCLVPALSSEKKKIRP